MIKFLKEHWSFVTIMSAGVSAGVTAGILVLTTYYWPACPSESDKVWQGDKICSWLVRLPKFTVFYLYRPIDGNKDLPLDSKVELQSGDYYRIHFSHDQYENKNWLGSIFFKEVEQSYVYIFRINNDQQIFRLFPQKKEEDNSVTNLKRKFDIPQNKDNPSFQLYGKPGREELYFLVFPQENKWLDDAYDKLLEAKQKPDAGQVSELRVTLRDFIRKQQLSDVSVLTFQHLERKCPKFPVEYTYSSDQGVSFQPFVNDSQLQLTDLYRIRFTPAEDCYVYVYQIDESEKPFNLVKESSFNHEVKGGVNYTLSTGSNAVAPEGIGRATIYFLAFKQTNISLDADNISKKQLIDEYLYDCQHCVVDKLTFQKVEKNHESQNKHTEN